jgi:DNA-binding MarR family transcriptional regulator
MVTVIDNLEHKGLAKRLPHPQDRRAVAVTLTAKARRLLPSLHDEGRDLEDEIAAPLSSKERAALRDLLQRVAAGAGLIPGVHPQLA